MEDHKTISQLENFSMPLSASIVIYARDEGAQALYGFRPGDSSSFLYSSRGFSLGIFLVLFFFVAVLARSGLGKTFSRTRNVPRSFSTRLQRIPA